MYYLFIVSPEVCVPSSPTGSESPVSSSVPSATASWSAPSSSSWHNTAIQNLSSLWIMALSYHWTDIVNAKGNMFIFKVKHSWIKTVLQGCHEPKFLKQHLQWRRKVTPYRNLKTSMNMISKHLKKKKPVGFCNRFFFFWTAKGRWRYLACWAICFCQSFVVSYNNTSLCEKNVSPAGEHFERQEGLSF